MTIEEVARAKAALEAEGTYPSYDAVLARVGHGSKRDVGHYMRALAGELNETVGEKQPVAPAPDPVVGPVWTSGSKEFQDYSDNLEPARAMGPLWEPHSPLAILWQTATAALAHENALAAEHQQVKAQRQALDAQLIHLDGLRQSRLSPAGAAQRREQEASTAVTRRETEEHRMQLYTTLVQTNLVRRQAEEAYRDRRSLTWALLRTMHEHQRRAASLTHAVQADSASQEALSCQARLAEAIGAQAARQLADHPELAPQWPGV